MLRRHLEPKPYASEDYQTILEAHHVTCSMSRRANCYDNAVMESFFSTVKSELGERFEAYGIAKEELFDYIEVFYNQQRRHSTLGQISPAAFERQAAARQAAQSTRPPKRINPNQPDERAESPLKLIAHPRLLCEVGQGPLTSEAATAARWLARLPARPRVDPLCWRS